MYWVIIKNNHLTKRYLPTSFVYNIVVNLNVNRYTIEVIDIIIMCQDIRYAPNANIVTVMFILSYQE